MSNVDVIKCEDCAYAEANGDGIWCTLWRRVGYRKEDYCSRAVAKEPVKRRVPDDADVELMLEILERVR